MSLRTKIVVALMALSSAAAVASGVWGLVDTEHRLRAEVERSLTDALDSLTRRDGRPPGRPPPSLSADGRPSVGDGPRPRSFERILVQVLDGNGAVEHTSSETELPVHSAEIRLAEASDVGLEQRRDVVIDGERFRVLSRSRGDGAGVVQAARSLAEIEQLVAEALRHTFATVAVVALAAALMGWVIAQQVTRRLAHLASAAEEVAATGRLDVAIDDSGSDESARLAGSFTTMLGALAESRESQRRLVQDAGHELRTPLTSLRTNVSLLRRGDELDAAARSAVLDDVESESRELTTLVDELVELASDRRDDEPVGDIDLAALVASVAARAERRTGRTITVTTTVPVTDDDAAGPSMVRGRAGALERAVRNLIENALKFDDSGEPVEVAVSECRVEVADRGPGIAESELGRVFDRFYRSDVARSLPGSGLGLAIVAAVAQSHDGRAFARPRDGGGVVVGFEISGSA